MAKKTKMRVTSLEAFAYVLQTIGDRQMQVLKAIRKIEPCSNTMLSKELRLPINCITGRVKELRDYGIIVMDKTDVCQFTNKRVTYWRMKKWLKEVAA